MLTQRNRRKWLTIILFLLPSSIGLLVFSVIPIVYSLVISFTDWNGLNPWNLAAGTPDFLGFGNFKEILAGEEFWRVLKNTMYYIVLYIPLILVASVLAAVLLNNTYKAIGLYRVVFFIPVLTSWVAAALIWKWLLSDDYGPVNAILGFVGVTGLMVAVTLLPYAALPRSAIAGVQQPSLASVLELVASHWGAVFISIGVLVSVLGAYLAWSLICAEVSFSCSLLLAICRSRSASWLLRKLNSCFRFSILLCWRVYWIF